MKQQNVRGTFKGGFYKGKKKTILYSGKSLEFSNKPEAVGIMCATDECWRCPRTKDDCGCKCHVA